MKQNLSGHLGTKAGRHFGRTGDGSRVLQTDVIGQVWRELQPPKAVPYQSFLCRDDLIICLDSVRISVSLLRSRSYAMPMQKRSTLPRMVP